jgi:hypothetical protein
MAIPAECCLPEQPGVLVLLRVDGHDPIRIDVDASEDLVEGFLPEPIGDIGVPP